MKKLFVAVSICALLGLGIPIKADAQIKEIVEFGLNVDRLAQLKSILTTMKKGFDIVSKGYGTVKDLSEGNFKLHKAFLDGLLEVSPTVKKYHKIPEVVSMQLALVRQTGSALKTLTREGSFSLKDMNYVRSVYSNLQNQSLQNLEELINVTTAGKLRMSDEDRLRSIDRIHQDMREKMDFLQTFNTNTMGLALEQKKLEQEMIRLKGLQGIDTKN